MAFGGVLKERPLEDWQPGWEVALKVSQPWLPLSSSSERLQTFKSMAHPTPSSLSSFPFLLSFGYSLPRPKRADMNSLHLCGILQPRRVLTKVATFNLHKNPTTWAEQSQFYI